MQLLTIGELARRTQVNVETVRYYERRGLLPPPARRASGYRQYDAGDVARMRAIRQAQRLGFTLREILTLLPVVSRPHPRCSTLRRHAQRKIEELTARISELQETRAELERLVDSCTYEPGRTRSCGLSPELSLANGISAGHPLG